jgi:hypothetical protein
MPATDMRGARTGVAERSQIYIYIYILGGTESFCVF